MLLQLFLTGFTASLLYASTCCYGQDKLITLGGDTIAVKIPAQAAAAGLPPHTEGKSIEYGFSRIAVVYPPDSVRLHLPGEIAGYIRQKAGRQAGAGIYLSKMVPPLTRFAEDRETKLLFMQRIGVHGDFSFWYFRQRSVYGTQPYYMFEVKGSEPVLIETYSQFVAWAQKNPQFSSLPRQIPATRSQKHNPYALFGYLQKLIDYLNKKP